MSDDKSTELLHMEDKVRRWLTDLVGSVESSPIYLTTFRYGSARIFVDLMEHHDVVFVRVLSCVVDGAKSSPELFEYIARQNVEFVLGRLQARDGDEDGLIDVWIEHNILADYLDQEELNWAVSAVASTADQEDTVMVERFGGKTTHDDED